MELSLHQEAEAATRTMSGLGVRAVRLLYTDLHGVARGKDIPIGHFPGLLRRASVLRGGYGDRPRSHAGRRRRGRLHRPAIRADLDTLRSVPGSRRWPGVSERPGRSTGPITIRPAPGAAPGVVDAYAARGLEPIVAPELEFFLAERDPEDPTASAGTSTSSRGCTPSARSPIRARSSCGCCSGAMTSGCRRSRRTTSS